MEKRCEAVLPGDWGWAEANEPRFAAWPLTDCDGALRGLEGSSASKSGVSS